jgi:hypothetical protein
MIEIATTAITATTTENRSILGNKKGGPEGRPFLFFVRRSLNFVLSAYSVTSVTGACPDRSGC